MKNKIFFYLGVFAMLLNIQSCSVPQSDNMIETAYPTQIPTSVTESIQPFKTPADAVPSPTPTYLMSVESHFKDLPTGNYFACYNTGKSGDEIDLYALQILDDVRYQAAVLKNIAPNTLSFNGKLATNDFKELYIIDFPSGTTKKMSLPEGVFDYQLSLNGSGLIAMNSTSFYVLSLDGDKWTEINILDAESDDKRLYGLSWSMDGKWVAFFIEYAKGPSEGAEGLYILNTSCFNSPTACSTKIEKIVDHPYYSTPITWTSDNRLAIVKRNESGDSAIDLYSIESHQKDREYSLPSNFNRVDDIFWSPVNDWISVVQYETKSVLLISTKDEAEKIVTSCIAGGWLGVP